MVRRAMIKAGFRNPWFWVFAMTASLQVFRGSLFDTTVFTLCTVAIWISASGVLGSRFGKRLKVARPWLLWGVVVFTVALSVFPRHSYVHGILVLALLPFVLRLVWYTDRGPKEKPDVRLARARMLWAILAVLITAWEFMANILGQLVNDLHIYPTISVLIDPMLDTIYGQAMFVVLWLLIGIGMLRLWERR
jgi:hypothetical protein